MCSNTGLCCTGGGGGGGGGGPGHSGGCDGDGIYLKKPIKRTRVPRRGPGVAELEKILREQEQRYNVDNKTKNVGNGGLPSFSPISISFQPQSSSIYTPSSNFLSKTAPFSPDPKQRFPPNTTLSGSGSSSSTSCNGCTIGVRVGRSGIVLPDHVWSPATWNGRETSNRSDSAGSELSSCQYLLNLPNHLLPSPTLMQRSQCLQPPAMINLFPHSSIPSSATPSHNGPGHCTEPPSNQTPNHHRHISLLPEEDKMIGSKRSCPFASDIPPAPSFRHPIPNVCPQMNILVDSSISTGNRSLMNLDQSSRAVPSDMKTGSSSEQNCRQCNALFEAADGNFILFASTGAPSQHQVSKFFPPLIHETMDESQHRLVKRGLFQKKPFLGSLLPAEQINKVETNFNFNNETVDIGGDDIDLSLKL